MNNEEFTSSLRALADSIDYRGLSNTLQLLRVPQKHESTLTEYEKKVFAAVEKYMGITHEQIVKARYVHGDIKYAMGFCVHFISEHKSLGEIKKFIFPNKTKSLLANYSRQVNMLSPTKKMDKKLYEIKEKIKSSL